MDHFHCYEAKANVELGDFLASFPNITLQLDDELLVWKSAEYLIEDIGAHRRFCVGIDSQV